MSSVPHPMSVVFDRITNEAETPLQSFTLCVVLTLVNIDFKKLKSIITYLENLLEIYFSESQSHKN